MNNLLESENDIGNSFDTIYSINAEILASKIRVNEIAKDIEEQHKRLLKNTLTRVEICEALGITEPTLIKRRNAGLIPFIQIGRNFYYLKPEAASCSK